MKRKVIKIGTIILGYLLLVSFMIPCLVLFYQGWTSKMVTDNKVYLVAVVYFCCTLISVILGSILLKIGYDKK